MCDTLIKMNIPKNEQPKFVYKRVQKIGEGEYISAVMGEPMKIGVWKTAPKRKRENIYCKGFETLARVFFKKRKKKLDKVTCKTWVTSSMFEEHHNGKWASFANFLDAERANMVSNFSRPDGCGYKTVVVKCQVGGEVHKASWNNNPTYLSSAIKIVEEIGSALLW